MIKYGGSSIIIVMICTSLECFTMSSIRYFCQLKLCNSLLLLLLLLFYQENWDSNPLFIKLLKKIYIYIYWIPNNLILCLKIKIYNILLVS
jgi:hypothetical protein